ncbi:G-protein coupled receptor moody-like isoform X2 [Asterias rubens]|uniref:G-protein coupled receptor moody-like isoform X2 n=1 Tax=Asterias rubens TaxID=7604 RepID=UPI001455754B|nr:G-protein coupled receptor moody-like isoform X2 [Asterias rubens]
MLPKKEMTWNRSSPDLMITDIFGDTLPNATSSVGVNVINASIGSIGALGNLLVIAVLLGNWSSFQSLTHMFILHQSFIDLTSSLLFMALRLDHGQGLLVMEGAVGQIVCKLWHSEYLLWALFMTSTLNLTLLTTERFFAVVHPVFHLNRFTRFRMKVAMLGVWLVSFGYQCYLAFIHELSPTGSCVLVWKHGITQVFVGIMTFIVEYLIPLTIMLVEYIFIAFKLNSLKRPPTITTIHIAAPPASSTLRKPTPPINVTNRLLSPETAVSDNTSNCYTALGAVSQSQLSNDQRQSPRTQSKPRLKQKECKFFRAFRNVIKTLCTVFITFVICWTPSEFTYLYYNVGGQLNFDGTLHRLSVVLVLCNMCANPFIYALQYKEFQYNFKKMFCSSIFMRKKYRVTTRVPLETIKTAAQRERSNAHN